MPGRKYSQPNSLYRYGFNGKEKSDEVYGGGNVYDYGFRIYNPRLGKFLSVDPVAKSYPWNSPFAFAENDVIRSIDLDGLEKVIIHEIYDKFGRNTSNNLSGIRDQNTKQAVDMNMLSASSVKLTTQDIYVIRHRDRTNNPIFFEGPAGSLTSGLTKHIASAPTTPGVPNNSQPDGTVMAGEVTGRGRFYKSDALNLDKFEFFESQFSVKTKTPILETKTVVTNENFVAGTISLGANISGTATDLYKTGTVSEITSRIRDKGQEFLTQHSLNVGAVEGINLTVPDNTMKNLRTVRAGLARNFNIPVSAVKILTNPDIGNIDAGLPPGTIKAGPGQMHVDATYSGVTDGNRRNAESTSIIKR